MLFKYLQENYSMETILRLEKRTYCGRSHGLYVPLDTKFDESIFEKKEGSVVAIWLLGGDFSNLDEYDWTTFCYLENPYFDQTYRSPILSGGMILSIKSLEELPEVLSEVPEIGEIPFFRYENLLRGIKCPRVISNSKGQIGIFMEGQENFDISEWFPVDGDSKLDGHHGNLQIIPEISPKDYYRYLDHLYIFNENVEKLILEYMSSFINQKYGGGQVT